MYHQHNNPLMRVSCWILEDDASARRKLLRAYLPNKFDKLPPDEQEEAIKTAQLEWRAEYNDGKVPMCSYSYRKASNMWNKLWMMHKNRAHNLSQYSADGAVMVSSSIISKARPPALRAYRPAPRTPCTCHVPCAYHARAALGGILPLQHALAHSPRPSPTLPVHVVHAAEKRG